VVANALVFFLTGAKAEGSDIPAAVPMQSLTPQVPEAAEGAPEPMEEVAEEAARRPEERRPPHHQRLLWRWLSVPRRSRTQSPSAPRR
jgi:uncharacterized protein YmfQ (DUF2313 family)